MTKANTDRRALEDWEKAECLALKHALARHNASIDKARRFTQDRLAAELGMTQGNLNGHLNGKRPLNKDMAAKIYALTGIPVSSYSERLAKELQDLAASIRPMDSPARPTTTSWTDQIEQLMLEVTGAISVIAAHAATRTLTPTQIQTLINLRNEIVHGHHLEPGQSLSSHLSGLIAAAFKTAESDGNPDDLLSMIKHGSDKENLKEQSTNVPARRSKTGSKSD